jgi:hypothetical protein
MPAKQQKHMPWTRALSNCVHTEAALLITIEHNEVLQQHPAVMNPEQMYARAANENSNFCHE